MDRFSNERQIIDSWHRNVTAWTDAVRGRRISSRLQVTDQAIIQAVMNRSPKSVIDIGCGEGWLSRELGSRGIEVLGVDAIPGLIKECQAAGGAEFRIATYDDIANGLLDAVADLVVCNFSLIGKEPVERLINAVPSLLEPGGSIVIQTLHPVEANGDLPYVDGWRDGSWSGFSDEFVDPAPWYFRTLESWKDLLFEAGFARLTVREPAYPDTGRPASVIFMANYD